ncbi:guanine nucleotide-binding protein-like 1 [Macrosteles quadrilineatus]|uniref:guanine nucleotide-binding protein-like 1 n=1 Tax=Macrosteles quadrilineatus TaxID=74068 RepID=UPI0023E1EC2D|nr:guanine nucleotide-binding protein-like 1 [Macrosteles quadrilineatus]
MPRKIPFSGKAKKQQLQEKKTKKSAFDIPGRRVQLLRKPEGDDDDDDDSMIQKINEQPKVRGGKGKPNRYALQFYKETAEEMRERKELARKELVPVPEPALEINLDDYFDPALHFPTRPPWNFNMSREELEAREQRYFTEYILDIEKKFNRRELSYFELNLETWRQLWRVLEMSDIVLVIVDIRYAALMFPPSLHQFVTSTLKKDMILVLNKVDLAPVPLVVAWTHYFLSRYPGLQVLQFTSFPSYNLRGSTQNKAGANIRRRKGRLRMAAEGAQKLFDVCKAITSGEVDLTSWQNKIKEEMNLEYDDEEDVEVEETVNLKKVDTSFVDHERFKGGVLTIGCVGQPNVGKSSLMNALMGKKVVSVSRTPGHTKHFQTIHLTANVRLCDCPGLVFPSKVPKSLQVLMGSYPIAQLRDPFSSVQYLAERLDLVKLLKLTHPEGDSTWSAMDVCDGWALKRGFRTAKAARLDSYRAANHILRMALDGKIALCLRPPGYHANKEFWLKHEELKGVLWVQARSTDEGYDEAPHHFIDEEDLSEEEHCEERTGRQLEQEERESEAGDEADSEDSGEDMAIGNKFNILASPD